MSGGRAGLANIGPEETRKRLILGVAMLITGAALAAVFARAAVSGWWYAALLLPFWIGTLALLQARRKT